MYDRVVPEASRAAAEHWDEVWAGRDPDAVTWFQRDLTVSRRLIAAVADPSSGIVDVGGGASRLVDHLLAAGHRDLTVVDIADEALALARARLGSRAEEVAWITADVTTTTFDRTFDLWHDRAVFHFLVDATDRDRYLSTLDSSLVVGGHLVISTFGPDGPTQCSGLPVRRYGIGLMQETLGGGFELEAHELEQHVAPSGVTQQFLAARFRRTA